MADSKTINDDALLQNEKTYDSVFWVGVVKLTKFQHPIVMLATWLYNGDA